MTGLLWGVGIALLVLWFTVLYRLIKREDDQIEAWERRHAADRRRR